MNKIIIFNLDDTLVNAKMKVPRQTYHMLNKFKKQGYIIGIITYNSMVNLVANQLDNLHPNASVSEARMLLHWPNNITMLKHDENVKVIRKNN